MIAGEYFIYIAIFGVLGSVVAMILDRRRLNRYWVAQAWLLRVIFWPLLLLSAGNLVLDYAFTEFTQSTTRTLVNIYESLWWIVAACLADSAIRRFLWYSLETGTGRKVPNVIKFFTSLVVFLLALAGVVAFVFNQTLTSLLATSGLMAMVIGLAVQANIANVFSGIVLNIERPFRVGDSIKINNIVGKVIDITWRTTRIESSEGQLVCLANSKVSEAEMQNFTAAPNGFSAEAVFHFNPDTDPALVLDILKRAVAASTIITLDDPNGKPSVRFRGIVCNNGYWAAEYAVGYRVKSGGGKAAAKEELWIYVRRQFMEQGLDLFPQANAAAANPPAGIQQAA
jgi:small-conductance mechanosensitive channel